MVNERRLIDVSDEHIKEILAPVPYYPDEIWKFTAMTKRFPTATDVAEVRHGSWIIGSREDGETDLTCGVCGAEYDFEVAGGDLEFMLQDDYHYCPNCGARMDGGADNG